MAEREREREKERKREEGSPRLSAAAFKQAERRAMEGASEGPDRRKPPWPRAAAAAAVATERAGRFRGRFRYGGRRPLRRPLSLSLSFLLLLPFGLCQISQFSCVLERASGAGPKTNAGRAEQRDDRLFPNNPCAKSERRSVFVLIGCLLCKTQEASKWPKSGPSAKDLEIVIRPRGKTSNTLRVRRDSKSHSGMRGIPKKTLPRLYK